MQDHLYSPGELILVGDLNFHLDEPSKPEPKRCMSLLESLNYKQHVMSPTHRSGHILDVVITRDCEDLVHDLEVSDMISDHNLVLCRLLHKKPKPQRVTITTRKLRSVDLEIVKRDIAALAVPSDQDTSVVDYYNQSLTQILDHHAPEKTKK
jgi:hypothetical protein